MNTIKCEICHITTSRVGDVKRKFMASFPLDGQRCKKWVAATGNEDLVYVPIEKLHQLKYICGKHFPTKDFKKKKTQLRAKAVPCIDIAAKPLPDDIFNNFPLHLAKTEVCRTIQEHNYCTFSEKRCTTTTSSKRKRSHSPSPQKSTPDSVPKQQGPQKSTPDTVPKQQRDGRSCSPNDETLLGNAKDHQSHAATKTVDHLEIPSTSTSISLRRSCSPSALVSEKSSKKICTRSRSCSPKRSKREKPQLTPRKRKLLYRLKETQKKVKVLQKKVDQIEQISSPVLKSLIDSSITNEKRKPKGRRWTQLNKTVALAIYKQSAKVFRYLSKHMPMPSIRSVQIILRNMKMEPGIDPTILEYLKKKIESLPDKDKLCVLLFDEIALKKRYIYNPATDQIDGFEDLGSEGDRTENTADHALVLMLQGVHKKIKQPIAYYFVKGTIASEQLTVIIKSAIRAVTEAGFTVLSTVCDQGPTNVGALNLLKKFSGVPADANYFLLDDEKVFTIYDVPHLFKSIRNNFYQAGEVVFNDRKGKWAHLVKAQEKNTQSLHFKKITKLHVAPRFRSKMRVKLAAQILSNTVAAILKLLSECIENIEESKEILQTAQIIEDFDRLFDCTNGPASKHDIKKGIRQNVTKNSFHHRLWVEYKRKLKTLIFLKSDSHLRLKNVRCVNGYLITITSLQDIWNIVHSKSFKYMNLRQFNQDALENLFGLIRQHCPTNKNPTCHHFVLALKSAILTRLSTPTSRGLNCQGDNNEILFDFHDIIFKQQNTDAQQPETTNNIPTTSMTDDIPVLRIPEEHADDLITDLQEIEKTFKTFEKQPTVYVAGYLACVLLRGVSCQMCINSMKVDNPKPNSIYNYIALREWWKDKISLTYPTINLCQALDSANKVFEEKVKPYVYYKNLCTFSKTEIVGRVDFSWMCEEHRNKILDQFLQRLSLLLIRNHCQIINRTFTLNEESSADCNKKAQMQSIAK